MRRSSPTGNSHEPRTVRAVAVVIGAAVAVALFALALVFSNAAGAARVAENARALHWANGTAGTAAVARAAVSQAVVFAVDRELGVADDTAVSAATAEATDSTNALEAWVAVADPSLIGGADAITSQGLTLVSTAGIIVELAATGSASAADDVFRSEFEFQYRDLTDRLTAVQNEIVGRIESTESAANTVSMMTRMLVTLLIPAAAIVIYFMLAQRQYRRARVQMHARIEAERELNRAKDEFIAGVSHELRTPLTSIYGFSEYLIENGIIDPNEAMELVGMINSDSADLSRMVEDLLTAARLDSDALTFEPEAVAILGEVEAVTEPFRRAGWSVHVEGSHSIVWADRARTRQVLRNLVSNAIKHGGPTIELHLQPNDEELELTVSDNGTGVPDEIADRLFERFVHDGDTALLAGSVGLGLSIARSLAHLTGGDVTYHRTHGWSNFVLTLPLATEEQIAAAHLDHNAPTEEAPHTTPDSFRTASEDHLPILEALAAPPTLNARTDPEFTVKF